jgi:hypothetical protein
MYSVPRKHHVEHNASQLHDESSLVAIKRATRELEKQIKLANLHKIALTPETQQVANETAKLTKQAFRHALKVSQRHEEEAKMVTKKRGVVSKHKITDRLHMKPLPTYEDIAGMGEDSDESSYTTVEPSVQAPISVRRCVLPGGCRHVGVMELRQLPKLDVRFYLEVGEFLHDRRCTDCAMSVEEFATTAMGTVAFVCDEGMKGFHANDQDLHKARLMCELILCGGCHVKRVNAVAASGAHRRRGNVCRV